jgi:tetraacyldisaccharide 4'-kinase
VKLRVPWRPGSPEPWWLRLALLPLVPLSLVYALGAAAHRGLYGWGVLRARRLPCRVISVGNLVVGGSAKTPCAAWLARELKHRGHPVAIASRGYGRRDREPVRVVSDGRLVHAPLQAAGDEPWVLAAHAPGVPVLVGRDRSVVGLRAVAAFSAGVLVLDDGFQHHRLARDVEIVLFDASGLGNGFALPRGPLREPARALATADAIGVIDGELPAADEALVRQLAPHALRFRARRVPVALRPLGGGAPLHPHRLRGQTVGMLCGLAQPQGFRRTLESLGASVVAERCFPDHHAFRAGDLANLRSDPARPTRWVTTEKDAAKILPSFVSGVDVSVLAIELEVEEDEALLDWVESRLR